MDEKIKQSILSKLKEIYSNYEKEYQYYIHKYLYDNNNKYKEIYDTTSMYELEDSLIIYHLLYSNFNKDVFTTRLFNISTPNKRVLNTVKAFTEVELFEILTAINYMMLQK